MFFIAGVNNGQSELPFTQTVVCPHCGRYGRYQVFMRYLCLSLFFLPVFKWNRRYFVRTSCCGMTYELNPEKGRAIARGADAVHIAPSDLTPCGEQRTAPRRCPRCGYETQEDFAFCPKCGAPMQPGNF